MKKGEGKDEAKAFKLKMRGANQSAGKGKRREMRKIGDGSEKIMVSLIKLSFQKKVCVEICVICGYKIRNENNRRF